MSMKLSFLLLGSLSIMVGSQVSGDPLQRSFSVNNQSAYKLANTTKLTILEKHKSHILYSQVQSFISILLGAGMFCSAMCVVAYADKNNDGVKVGAIIGGMCGGLTVYSGVIGAQDASEKYDKADKIEELINASKK